MATLGEQLLERLDKEDGAPSTNAPLGTQVIERLQLASQMGGGIGSVNAPPSMQRPPEGVERFAREGVPLDVSSGASYLQRAGLSFQPTEEERLSFLQRSFQGASIEKADDNFIIRNVMGADGKPKDLLIDEKGFSPKDVADFADVAPQLAAEVMLFKGLGLAKRFGDLGRFKRVMAESGVGAGAGLATGTAADIATRVGEQPLNMSEILQRRGTGAAGEFGMGSILGASAEAVAALRDASKGKVTGVLSPGPTELKGIEAIADIERQTGIAIQPTLGQMSQDPNVLRLESFMSRIPFFGRRFTAMAQRQEEQIRNLQLKLMDETPVTPLADLGAEVTDTVRGIVREPQASAAMATTSLANRAADEMETAITRMAPSAVRLTPETTSDLLKFSTQGRFNEFRAKRDELYSLAGNPSIPTGPMNKILDSVEAKLPKEKVELSPTEGLSEIVDEFENDVSSFLLDASGKPVVSEGGKRINRDLVPASLSRLIRGLRRLGDEVPLEQLRTVRNTVESAIREGRGLEGIDTFQLKQVSHAITETIEKGVDAMPDQAAAQALKTANAFYKENIEKFEVPIVARLLKQKPDQPGFIGGFSLMNQIRSNPDEFRQVEQFLKSSLTQGGKAIGPTSNPTFNLLRRSILEDIYRRASTSPGSGRFIDVDSFVRDLGQFDPEIQSVILGVGDAARQRTTQTGASVIEKNLNLLRTLKGKDADVPIEDLNFFLKNPSSSLRDLQQLTGARKRERELFENEIVKKMFAGESVELLTSRGGLKNDQVIDWLLNAKNESDVTMFMSMVGDNPEVVKKIRANTVADFFQEVAQKARPEEAALRDSTHLVNPQKLITAIRDPEQRRRLKIILGQDNFNILDSFASAQTVLGRKSGQTLEGTQSSMKILTDVTTLLRNLPDTAKFILYSQFLTDKTLQRMIQEGSFSKATDIKGLTRMLALSPPVLEALADEYGKTGAELIIQGIKDAVGTVRNEEGLQQQGTNQTR